MKRNVIVLLMLLSVCLAAGCSEEASELLQDAGEAEPDASAEGDQEDIEDSEGDAGQQEPGDEDDVVETENIDSQEGQDSEPEIEPSEEEPYITFTGTDWRNRGCSLYEDECERRSRNKDYNSACARLLYSSNAKYVCHLWIDGVMAQDEAPVFNDPKIPRVYQFVPSLTAYDLNEEMYYYKDTRLKLCCTVDDTDRLKQRDYDVCKTVIVDPLCPEGSY
ncbi:hypothetical protein GF351_01665 [Candidatus Woesearchaeota archaeon]|nr:hypothetical protein [Candidatus Woesearchaeota archaeon]